MGVIISRFRRKKTTTEVLERLETKIKSIEQDGQYKEQTHKRVIGYVMAYSVGLYVLFAILYYFMYVGKSQYWLHSVLHASPLLVLPILVIFLRSAISWYYNWSLNKNKLKLSKMRDEKKKILEEVMNTETYKVAKEILDKYGSPDDQSKALKPFVPSVNVPGNPGALMPMSPVPATPGQLRQRQIALTSTPFNNNMNNALALNNSPTKGPRLRANWLCFITTPGQLRQRQIALTSTPFNNNMNNALALNNSPAKGPRLRSEQLPHPLLDKNRSALDKVVDYLLRDGPNQRMALICKHCTSHNGMAMMEEFEYVSYVCAYCGNLNPSRKQRPAAPLLTPARALPPIPRRSFTGAGDESSVASSGSDSEDEKKLNDGSPRSSENASERSPSPVDEAPKSNLEKKED